MPKKLKGFFRWLDKRPIFQCGFSAIIINYAIEALSRSSLYEGLEYMLRKPHLFILNSAIIMATLCISRFFNRRRFLFYFISIVWLAFGIVNCVLINFRTSPFEAVDFLILRTGLGIITVYLTTFQIIAIAMALIAVLAAVVIMWFKIAKSKVNLKEAVIASSISTLLAVLLIFLLRATTLLPDRFADIGEAYRDYGFVYCFSSSIFDRGIGKPDDYSEATVKGILKDIGYEDTYTPKVTPNIVFVQLESFFDVSYLRNITCSENPIPTFTELKENYTSGLLSVPSTGAGTANTEFEVISGMRLDHFGTGEYPYKSFLKDMACETIGFNLKELGYSAHAIHNYTAGFYDRNIAYASLGFDTFTSIEYMHNLEYNPLGWAKDSVLTEEIAKALKSTKGRDFVYTVSVQGHGKYPDEVLDHSQKISVTRNYGEEEVIGYEYYVNQLKEMDDFISELIRELSSYPEEVVVVFFGDHLPSIGFTKEDIITESLYQTEYVIWSNFQLEEKDRDLAAYQLYSYTLEQLGINNGILPKFHQNYSKEDYDTALETLEYDMLYGDKTVFEGEYPFTRTDLKLGIDDITITGVAVKRTGNNEEFICIMGENFNEWSTIYINGKKIDTSFEDGSLLMASNKGLKKGDTIKVVQLSHDNLQLSETEGFLYQGE